YQSDGQLDPTFNGSGKLFINSNPDNYPTGNRRVMIQPDGKIVVPASYADTLQSYLLIYRFLEDGSPDNTFDGDGKVETPLGKYYFNPSACVLQPDGKILVGGYIGGKNDSYDQFFIARYSTDGKLDKSFDGDGIVTTTVGEDYTHINALIIQPDGKIVAAGGATFNGHETLTLARYSSTGALDHSFSGDGITTAVFDEGESRGMGCALLPNGKIICGGYVRLTSTALHGFAAACFNSDGTLDNTFNGDGKNTYLVSGHSDGAWDVALQPDGKILLGGYAHSDVQGSDMAIVRINGNGIPDNTFSDDGVAIYEDGPDFSSNINGMTLQPDGKVVTTGFHRISGINSIVVARMITGLTTSTAEPFQRVKELSVFPNPVHDQFEINYSLDQKQSFSINLYDVQGRLIQSMCPLTEHDPGPHHDDLRIDSQCPAGNYYLTLSSGQGSQSIKIVLDR
ncbi:MAG TPA: T9SS type A sorting domain-containing protein, partial [Saprospiraceae bacterium]|nr:T9SS type A sorting domain-containing protein [Saprospiraceae bacterium]